MRTLIASSLLVISTGSSAQYGSWIPHGPDLGGRLSSVVASRSDTNILIVASPGGGVWRTADGGAHWTRPRNYALSDFSVLDLQWDVVRPGRLYASTYSDLYASTDLGDHWTNLTNTGGTPASLLFLRHGNDPKAFTQLRFSATQSAVLWSKPGKGLFYSYDGSSFTAVYPFRGAANNTDNFIQSIAVDDTGYVYFSTMAEYLSIQTPHVYRSTLPWTVSTASLTWEFTSIPAEPYTTAISLAGGSRPRRMAALTNELGGARIYRTLDGMNWEPFPTQPAVPNWEAAVLAAPADNQLLLGAVRSFHLENWESPWDSIVLHYKHADVRSFFWHSYPSGNYLWETTDGASNDGGYMNIVRSDFTPGSPPSPGHRVGISGLKVWQAYYMAVTSSYAAPRRRIFLGSQDNGAIASDDNGNTWTWEGLPPTDCGDNICMVFAPGNPDRAYARTCNSRYIARSDNAYSAATAREVVWINKEPPVNCALPAVATNAMIAVDPANPDRVATARLYDVIVSLDSAHSWLPTTFPFDVQPVSVCIEPDGPIYAGTIDRGIYISDDNGATWTPFGLNTARIKAVLKIIHTAAGGPEGTFFAATSSGLYRKISGGSFEFVAAAGAGNYVVNDVEVDWTCPNRIYIAKGFISGVAQHRGGVLVSQDNGSSFTSITSGQDIHQTPISDIQVDPADPRYLHAASYGLGSWTYDLGSSPPCN